jgi:Skp family chaperone for outer membrane proteins
MKKTNLLVLALSLTFATAYAQSGQEQILNSAPINVDGYLSEAPVTDGELESIRSELNKQKTGTQLNKEKAKDLNKLTNQTEKLLDSQDEYIDNKIESANAIKEFNAKYEENQKKLRCIMEESSASECDPYKNKYRRERAQKVEQEINTQQAAPVISTQIAPVSTGAPFEAIKLLPFAGATSYNGDFEQLESEISAGLRLESNINERFSVGVGFNFGQLRTNDFGNGQNYMNSFMYNNAFGPGREIQYRGMGLDIYGKFFITKGERFRPYIGAGLGYNRARLRYTDNNNFFDPTFQSFFGEEEYNSSFVSGLMMMGSEIMITQTFGINIEGAYSTGLGDSLSSRSAKNGGTSLDQRRLRDLGEEIINSNALSIFLGAVVNF